MTGPVWNPNVYLAFDDERGRPFFDLLARIGAREPRRVVDLGCGPGNLTGSLNRRWPGAVVEAVDSSPEMVAEARERGVDAQLGDLRSWSPAPDTDVVLSNAALQWVPEHRELLVRWAAELGAGAWIAMQVPGNFDAPSHALVRELAARRPWSELLAGVSFRAGGAVDTPAGYTELLVGAGCEVDAWETTYLHQLTGVNPVLRWITGTALTPVKARLDEQDWRRFQEELSPLLGEAYPMRADGVTLFGFRRVFAVGRIR